MLASIATLSWVLAATDPHPCSSEDFEAVQARLGQDGRLEVQSVGSGLRIEVWDAGRVLWSGRIQESDCLLVAEVVDIHVRRRLAPERIQPLGELPALSTPVLSGPAKEATPDRGLSWKAELGAGVLWELGGEGLGRVGGQVDGALGRGPWSGRLELGLMAPDGADVVGAGEVLGRGRLSSLHLLVFARGCRMVGPTRLCAHLGGGAEHVWARADGVGVFQEAPGSAWLARGEGVLSWGLGRAPGVELLVRGTVRSRRLSLGIESAGLELGLPPWSAQLGLRTFLEIL
ncbi:MAG: hypothetical protein AAGD10_10820 [Myxococcota bacterium]